MTDGSQPPYEIAAPSAPRPVVQSSPTASQLQPPTTPEEVALDRLLDAAEPLVKAYFDNQALALEVQAKQREHELAFERYVLEHESRRHRMTLIAASVIGAIVLGFAGFLVWNGRDAVALDIIKLLVAIASVGFGGYGVGMSRRRREKPEE